MNDLKKASEIALVFIALTLFVFLLQHFKTFLRPLAIAFILSFLFTPFFRLSGVNRIKRYLQFFLVAVFVLAIIVLLSKFIGSGVGTVAGLSGSNATADFFADAQSISIFGLDLDLSNIISIERITSLIGSLAQALVSGILAFAGELILVVLLLLFIVPAQKAVMRKLLIRQTINKKDHRTKRALSIYEDLEKGISEYLKTKATLSLMVTLTSALIMFILGIENILLFSLLLFSLNFIPNFGDYISFTIIFGVQAFTIGIGTTFFLLFGLLLAVQVFFANYIEPRYSGKQLDLSPLTVFVSLLLWGSIWGVGGMLFSVPFTVAIKTILEHNKSTEWIADLLD